MSYFLLYAAGRTSFFGTAADKQEAEVVCKARTLAVVTVGPVIGPGLNARLSCPCQVCFPCLDATSVDACLPEYRW